VTTIVDAPARADDLLLLGTMVGSGYRTPPALVRRGDGQTLQLTPLLYQVLNAVDGRRSCAEVADVVRGVMRRDVSAEMVAALVDQHLRPMGLLKLADGSEPPLKRSNPLLALRLKFAVTDPQATRRLTDPFRVLFRPAVVTLVLLGFLAVTWWVFFHQGLAPAAYDAFQRPHLLLLVFAVTVVAGGFHEFGHAAAARYGGADPGVIGAGIYLVWPAFYTDVTDSYRLGRRGRIRTDLGGLYFNAVVVVLTFVWWYTTRWEAVLLVVATQILQMVQQLMPLLRFDGYHVLADLTGVPDLYHRIRPTLLGLLPHRWSHPANRVLKPWARVVITAWVLVTIPMMAFMLLTLVTSLPRVLGTAWVVAAQDAAQVVDAWRAGGLVDIAAHAFQVVAVVLPVMAGLMILTRIGLRWTRGLARWSRGSAPKRATAVAVISVVATALSWAWGPRPGNYRPITPDERGLLTAVLPQGQSTGVIPALAEAAPAVPVGGVLPVGASAERRLSEGAPLVATFRKGQALPTRTDPQLAVVLVPTGDTGTSRAPSAQEPAEAVPDDPEPGPEDPADPTDPTEPWVFPFDKPLPPAEGDNQAAAYNITDGTAKYDIAFALVWATGDEVLNVNEAHAYASCTNCVTVAVAFQVVLIMDNAHVVVPQNLSVAANWHCYRCVTAAIASQLVLSVEDDPAEQQLRALGEVWGRLTDFGRAITSYSLSQVSDRLDAFKAEIVAILDDAPPVSPGTPPTPGPSPSGTPSLGTGQPSPSSPADPSPGSPTTTPGSSDPSPETSPSSPDPSPNGSPTSPDPSPHTSPSSPDPSPDPPPSSPDTSPESSPDTSPRSPESSPGSPTTAPEASSADAPSPGPSPTHEATPESTPESTPEPTPEATPEPTTHTPTATPPPGPESASPADPSPSP
jgi:putative peptide zinc metalloprotease protein